MKITVVRHAESIYNHHRRLGKSIEGLEDCGLSHEGRVQASKLKRRFEVILLSPLRRCQETLGYSKIIAPEIVTTPLLREIKTDICDFLKDEEIEIETEDQAVKRTEEFKKFLRETYKNKDVCVISHSVFLYYLCGKRLKNAEMIKISV